MDTKFEDSIFLTHLKKYQVYIEELKAEKRIENVFHYTSQYAFKEILFNKEIWLSNIFDMNDPSEIYFGIDVIIEILRTNFNDNSLIVKTVIEAKNDLKRFNRFIEINSIFLISFSEKDDDLKQWIQYADNGKGLSLQFILYNIDKTINLYNRDFLKNMSIPLMLLPINYFFKNSFQPINNTSTNFTNMIINVFSEIHEKIKNLTEIHEITKRAIFDYVILFSSFIKQSLYQAENEWRLIIQSNGVYGEKIQSKIINGVAQLKLVLNLKIDNSELLFNMIERVMIGPKNFNLSTNEISLRKLVKEINFHGHSFNITRSSGEIR